MTSLEDGARRLGAMLRCAPVEDAFEYRFMFDLTANTFLQKLVPKRIMDRKLNLASGTHFRSLAVLSYAVSVLDEGEKLLANVAVLSEEHDKIDRKAGLPLGAVTTEIALHVAEHGADGDACHARFERLDAKRCTCDASRVDPYYEAMGHVLIDQLALKDAARKVSSKGEYLAAVFADALVAGSPADGDHVARRLLAGESWDASMDALRARAATVKLADLEKYFEH